MSLTRVLGIAKPMPGAAEPPSSGSVAASVGMPMTRPSMSASAPPELPGLIAALVWIIVGSATPFPSETPCRKALTIPSVTLDRSPNGFPIAIAKSPISSLFDRERRRYQMRTGDMDDGEVVGCEPADELGAVGVRSGGDRERPGVTRADHVVVRDDVAVRVEDDARAEPRGGLDLDDRRRELGARPP